MSRQILNFAREPRGNLYRQILDYALPRCQSVLLVLRPSPALALCGSGIETMRRLEEFLIEQNEASEWPGTELLSGTKATVFKYKYVEACASILKEAANSLYSWKEPYLPEDLCFLRPDGEVFLASIAHERDGYFCVSDEERGSLIETFPELEFQVKEL